MIADYIKQLEEQGYSHPLTSDVCRINDPVIGFGGVEFKENPGVWYTTMLFIDTRNQTVTTAIVGKNDCCIPATPHRVRFLNPEWRAE